MTFTTKLLDAVKASSAIYINNVEVSDLAIGPAWTVFYTERFTARAFNDTKVVIEGDAAAIVPGSIEHYTDHAVRDADLSIYFEIRRALCESDLQVGGQK